MFKLLIAYTDGATQECLCETLVDAYLFVVGESEVAGWEVKSTEGKTCLSSQ